MTTELLDTYKDFVYLRQETFLKKLKDPKYVSDTLGTNKFTNVHRVFDRVSQYQLAEILYKGSQNPYDVLVRIFLFDQFKTIAFWDTLKASGITKISDIPEMVKDYQGDAKLFTNAYVVPGEPGKPKAKTITDRTIKLVECKSALKEAIASKDINKVYSILTSISGIGGFLGSQVCFDFLWHESTAGWKPLYQLGVGAIRGATKIGLNPKNPKESLEAARKLLVEYPYAYANGQPVPLFPADIQNTFCESDKWFRLVRPDIKTSDKAPTSIKNRYKPGSALVYKVPGFWVGTNGLVEIDK